MNFDYLPYLGSDADARQILHDLMTAYGDDVWNYAFLLCKRTDLADDITQDTFLKAYRHLSSFRGQSSVKTWLFTIARNTAFDYRKSGFFKRVLLSDAIEHRGSHPSAEAEAMDVIISHELWEHVMNLPVKLRESLILYAHHQLKIREIAQLLELSEGTVKSRIFKARLKLTQMIGEREQYG